MVFPHYGRTKNSCRSLDQTWSRKAGQNHRPLRSPLCSRCEGSRSPCSRARSRRYRLYISLLLQTTERRLSRGLPCWGKSFFKSPFIVTVDSNIPICQSNSLIMRYFVMDTSPKVLLHFEYETGNRDTSDNQTKKIQYHHDNNTEISNNFMLCA